MVKNTGRKLPDRDATIEQYLAALPGRPDEVAGRLGVSLRRCERALNGLARRGMALRSSGVYSKK